MQAALNAMASASPQWGPMDALPDEMSPTTPAAAAAVLHVRPLLASVLACPWQYLLAWVGGHGWRL